MSESGASGSRHGPAAGARWLSFDPDSPTPVGLVVAFVLLIVVTWTIVTWTAPLPGDASVFVWLADTAVRGGAPYRDAFDTKGPMAWLPVAAVRAVLPLGHEAAIRVVEVVSQCMLAVALVHLVRRLVPAASREREELAVAALALCWWIGFGYWNTLQPDGWAAAWVSTACVFASAGGSVRLLMAGVLVACAAGVKPHYAAMLLPVLLFAVDRHGWVPRTLAVVGGFVAGLACIAGVLSSLGSLEGLREAWTWTAAVYAGSDASIITLVGGLATGLVSQPLGVAAPLAFAGLAGLWTPSRPWRFLALASWLFGAMATVAIQGRFWPYHWFVLVPPLAACAGVAFADWSADSSQQARVRRGVVLATLLVTAAVGPARAVYGKVRAILSSSARLAYEAREYGSYGTQPGSVRALLDSLGPQDAPTEAVLVWGFYPAVPMFVDRQSVGRLGIMLPLFRGDGTEERRRYRREFLADLRSRPPRWWLIPLASFPEWPSMNAEFAIDRFPEAMAFRDSAYVRVGTSGHWEIWRRRTLDHRAAVTCQAAAPDGSCVR